MGGLVGAVAATAAPMAVNETRAKLLRAAADTVREDGVAAVSARTVAARAGVNQALVFYHFGTVAELVARACRVAVDEAVDRYRERFAAVTSLAGLLGVGRDLHRHERLAGNVAMMAQLMAGAPGDPQLAAEARYAMDRWIGEVTTVLDRILVPPTDLVDVAGLARAISASFIGIELCDGVDPAGATRALDALATLGASVGGSAAPAPSRRAR